MPCSNKHRRASIMHAICRAFQDCIPRGHRTSSIWHAEVPTHRGAEAKFILSTRSCAPLISSHTLLAVRFTMKLVLVSVSLEALGLVYPTCGEMTKRKGTYMMCSPDPAGTRFDQRAIRPLSACHNVIPMPQIIHSASQSRMSPNLWGCAHSQDHS